MVHLPLSLFSEHIPWEEKMSTDHKSMKKKKGMIPSMGERKPNLMKHCLRPGRSLLALYVEPAGRCRATSRDSSLWSVVPTGQLNLQTSWVRTFLAICKVNSFSFYLVRMTWRHVNKFPSNLWYCSSKFSLAIILKLSIWPPWNLILWWENMIIAF